MTPQAAKATGYELFSHEAYLAGEHGNFARALARAAVAADSVHRDLLRFFWPEIINALEHSPHTQAPWQVPRVRLLGVKIEHRGRRDSFWGQPASCTGLFDTAPGAKCSDCDATYFGLKHAEPEEEETP